MNTQEGAVHLRWTAFLLSTFSLSKVFCLFSLKSREIISISEMGLPSRHTEPSASLLFPKGDEPFPAVGKAQLYPNHPAVSASYTMDELLDELDSIECFIEPGKAPIQGEVLAKQEQLYRDLGVTPL